MTDSIEYEFEEIHIMGEGVLASGTATLESAGEGYEGEFFVSHIKFTKGPSLDVRNLVKGSNHAWLFNKIATEIEASSDAQETWAEHERGLKLPTADHARKEAREAVHG